MDELSCHECQAANRRISHSATRPLIFDFLILYFTLRLGAGLVSVSEPFLINSLVCPNGFWFLTSSLLILIYVHELNYLFIFILLGYFVIIEILR